MKEKKRDHGLGRIMLLGFEGRLLGIGFAGHKLRRAQHPPATALSRPQPSAGHNIRKPHTSTGHSLPQATTLRRAQHPPATRLRRPHDGDLRVSSHMAGSSIACSKLVRFWNFAKVWSCSRHRAIRGVADRGVAACGASLLVVLVLEFVRGVWLVSCVAIRGGIAACRALLFVVDAIRGLTLSSLFESSFKVSCTHLRGCCSSERAIGCGVAWKPLGFELFVQGEQGGAAAMLRFVVLELLRR
ncbi:hypothetical protein Droror1_Dr00024342 [Drosera rotundifolia]